MAVAASVTINLNATADSNPVLVPPASQLVVVTALFTGETSTSAADVTITDVIRKATQAGSSQYPNTGDAQDACVGQIVPASGTLTVSWIEVFPYNGPSSDPFVSVSANGVPSTVAYTFITSGGGASGSAVITGTTAASGTQSVKTGPTTPYVVPDDGP